MNKITKPGIYQISMEEYQRDPSQIPSLTRSTVRNILECPARAYNDHPRLNPLWKNNPGSEAMKLGTLAHSLFLEGVDIAEPLDYDDWRKTDAREARAFALVAGKIPILRHQYNDVIAMVESANIQLADSELGIQSLKNEGVSERTFLCEKDGVWFRARPDWISNDYALILDFKTTAQSADPVTFSRNIVDTGIDIQAELYTNSVEILTGVSPKFVIMVQETCAPYLCSFQSLSPQFLDLGKRKLKEAVTIWKKCMATGMWEGYPKRIAYVEPPPWAMAKFEEMKFTKQLLENNDPTEGW